MQKIVHVFLTVFIAGYAGKSKIKNKQIVANTTKWCYYIVVHATILFHDHELAQR